MLRRFSTTLPLILVLSTTALAQKDRILTPIDGHRTIALKGHVPYSAKPEFDQGLVDPAQEMRLITLVLKPTDAQQAELEQLLTEQQDPFSPNYHKWLTPEEYADRFGMSQNDLNGVVSWLRAEGFEVDDLGRGRNWVVFHGSAGQVRDTFLTEIHNYRVDGELHYANATNPSVPAALESVVRGLMGLDDFQPQKLSRTRHPDFTSSSGDHYLSPEDLGTIYDLTPLLNNGFNGSGQKIAIAGRTDIDLGDIRAFRTRFNLPPSDPQLVLVAGSADPGTTADLDEADLDLEVSGGVARNASIIYVYSTNVDTSVLYAISQNLAPVISYSYGICEPKRSSGYSANLQAAAQQGNAQGITWVVSSGDSGAAECDKAFSASSAVASQGQYPSFPATIPEVTGVGGTQFNESGGNYWRATNSANGGSALSYIPEIGWNESSTDGLASTGGGLSIFYPKPSWQTGPGVPAGNVRTTPDVALSAAGHDGYLAVSGGKTLVFSGTSASAPAFAGILGLLNQYQVAKGLQAKAGLGNVNPNIYRLAQSGGGVFHDITGGSNIVPCVANSSNCVNGQLGFKAGPGYDMVTGWGSVDGNNMVTQWSNRVVNTTTTVTATPSSFGLNGSTVLTATVAAVGSAAAPSGAVSFNFGNTALGTATLATAGAVTTASITVFGSQLTTGNDTITANYGGNSTFNGSSGTVTVTVNLPTGNSAIVPSIMPNPVFQQQADADGYSWFYTLRLTEVAGSPTTLTNFTIDGTDYTSSINSFFGSSAIAARGSLSASLRTRGLTVPVVRVFVFSGKDGDGRQWTQQLFAPFYGAQITASMSLDSVPGTVRQNPNAASNCQWLQHLGLQETNGHSVQLTKFLAGGFDLSGRIQEFFNSTTLPALGSLLAGLCWSGVNPVPQTKNFEIDGIDDTGTMISTTLTAKFDTPSTSNSSLSTSAGTLSFSASGAVPIKQTNISINVASGLQWTVSVFPSNRTTRWLSAYPQSGTGTTNLTVVADSTSLANGVYTATLVFQSPDALPQFIDVPVALIVGATGGASPALQNNSVVSAANYRAPVAPGSLVSIFGSRFADLPQYPPGLPLPVNMNGLAVYFNGIAAPLVYVSSGQINAQVPFEVRGPNASVIVTNSAGVSNSISLGISAAAPAIFTQDQSGNGPGAILDALTGGLITSATPIARGRAISIFGSGIGPVDNQPASGAAAGSSPLSRNTNTVTVTIGGLVVTPDFSGLAPGFVGLGQVNAFVPGNAPTGPAVPLTITSSGNISNTVTLAIR